MIRKTILSIIICLIPFFSKAQQYNGMTGYIHTPSGEMNSAGNARVGAHFVNKEMMPDKFTCPDDEGIERKYNSASYYLSITPFSWVEVSYTCVLFKYNSETLQGYKAKDRHFAAKVRLLKESMFLPAVAAGCDDILGSTLDVSTAQAYFANVWIAAYKHINIAGNVFSLNVGYRQYQKDWNSKYDGLNAAVCFRPFFAPSVRTIIEWDGNNMNFGMDALIWKRLLIQISMHNGNHISAGLAYQINLMK